MSRDNGLISTTHSKANVTGDEHLHLHIATACQHTTPKLRTHPVPALLNLLSAYPSYSPTQHCYIFSSCSLHLVNAIIKRFISFTGIGVYFLPPSVFPSSPHVYLLKSVTLTLSDELFVFFSTILGNSNKKKNFPSKLFFL